MRDIEIRRAAYRDIPALVELLGDLFAIEADFEPDAEKQAAGLRMLLDNPAAGVVFAALAGGEVVGMVSMQILVSTAQGAKAGLVEDMVVSGDYRGRGIGSRLLASLDNYAAENDSIFNSREFSINRKTHADLNRQFACGSDDE